MVSSPFHVPLPCTEWRAKRGFFLFVKDPIRSSPRRRWGRVTYHICSLHTSLNSCPWAHHRLWASCNRRPWSWDGSLPPGSQPLGVLIFPKETAQHGQVVRLAQEDTVRRWQHRRPGGYFSSVPAESQRSQPRTDRLRDNFPGVFILKQPSHLAVQAGAGKAALRGVPRLGCPPSRHLFLIFPMGGEQPFPSLPKQGAQRKGLGTIPVPRHAGGKKTQAELTACHVEGPAPLPCDQVSNFQRSHSPARNKCVIDKRAGNHLVSGICGVRQWRVWTHALSWAQWWKWGRGETETPTEGHGRLPEPGLRTVQGLSPLRPPPPSLFYELSAPPLPCFMSSLLLSSIAVLILLFQLSLSFVYVLFCF